MSLKGSREWWEDNGLYRKGWGSNSDYANCHDWGLKGGVWELHKLQFPPLEFEQHHAVTCKVARIE